MKFKYFSIVLFFSVSLNVFSAERNLCDDLIDSGTSSPEQIKKCLEDPRFGPSTHYKEQEAKKKIKIETAKVEEADTIKKNNNLEIKKFNIDELFDAGFGKPFYAIRGDYRNHRYKEKRITEGDALCTYLGYEKSLKSIVSAELWENKNVNVKVDKQGLIIDGKVPEMYRDEDYKFTVRKYVEITCARRKDKSIDSSNDVLKAITEDLLMLNEELNTSTGSDSSSKSNNSGRSAKDSKTANGYNPPDWAQDSQSISK